MYVLYGWGVHVCTRACMCPLTKTKNIICNVVGVVFPWLWSMCFTSPSLFYHHYYYHSHTPPLLASPCYACCLSNKLCDMCGPSEGVDSLPSFTYLLTSPNYTCFLSNKLCVTWVGLSECERPLVRVVERSCASECGELFSATCVCTVMYCYALWLSLFSLV